jgi:predicted permease
MFQDTRYAFRLMRRQPAFTLLAIGTLAIGIAASTAVFTVCDRVLIRPLPYPSPDRVVLLDDVPFAFATKGMGVRRDVRDLPELAAVGLYASGGMNFGDAEGAYRLRAAAATSGFFDALGVKALLGRTFVGDDDRAASPLVVLSFDVWQRLFAGDRGVLNREVRLNSHSFTVIGVMPRGFTFPESTDVWVPPASDSQITGSAFAPIQIARLAPAVAVPQAVAALTRLNDARKTQNPGLDLRAPKVTPLQDDLTINLRPTLLFLTGVVALLLAVTSANIAGLILSRLRTRERELLVRTALGAPRGRLVRQVATECAMLGGGGAAVGWVLAVWTVHLFRAAMPAFAPDADLTSLDLRFFAVGLFVAFATTLLFGLGPALAAGRQKTGEALRHALLPSRRSRWLSQGLVISQVAVSLMLLVAGSAALAVLVKLTRVDLGFRNDRAVVFELTLPASRYERTEAIADFWNRLEARLAALPGLVHAGATSYAPGSRQIGVGVRLRLAGVTTPDESTSSASVLAASPDYFRAMGIPLVAGRTFTAADGAGAPAVAVLSRTAARMLQPDGATVVGKHLQFARMLPADVEIVGVVDDTRLRNLKGTGAAQLYQPLSQSVVAGSLGVAIDAAGDETTTIAGARAALYDVDPELPLYNVIRVRDVRARFMTTERLALAMSSAFAAVGLLLSAIGLYGVLSQSVTLRRREIGIRMALGANRARLHWDVVRVGLGLAVTGVVTGALASFGAARAASAIVPGLGFVTPSAPSIGVVGVLLMITAVAAAWAPARRASSVDPIQVLRE